MKPHLRPLVPDRARNHRRYLAACDGKARFATRSLALKVARKPGQNIYHCKGCGFWHIGREMRKGFR